MTTDPTKNYKQSTKQPNQKQNGPGERPVDTNDRDGSTRGDHRGQKASDNRLDTTKNASSEQAEREDERYDDDDFGQANDVTAAAREDDEGSHEPGQSRGSMSSDRGLRASHAQNRASVSEQEERISCRPNRKEKESEQTNQR